MAAFRSRRVRAAAFALLPVLVAAGAIAATQQRASLPRKPAITAEQWQPRPGDVILTAAEDLVGDRIASASGEEAVYSHIGLVVEHDGKPVVIESSPMSAGHVAFADLTDFTTNPGTTDLLVLRPRVAIDAARLNREAERLAAAAVPFDFALDMKDGSRLYCAELVYNLLATAGVDLSSVRWIDAYVPLSGDQRLVAPDAFASTTSLEPIFRRGS